MKLLSGKRAICFGDSITWYDGHAYNWGKEAEKIAKGFESYLRDAGMHVKNNGISNATILDIRKQLLRTDIGEFDYVLLSSGANDSRYGIPCGHLISQNSDYDVTSFCGCLQDCIEHIQHENPLAEIVLMTPIKGWIYAPDGYEYERTDDGVVEECYAETIIAVAKAYQVSVCDWYHDSGIELESREQYINDPEPNKTAAINPNPFYSLHPSSEGYRRMSEMLLNVLRGEKF